MIGPFMAPYFGGIKEAGYLVVSQSLLRVVEGGVEGFSRVALPKVAQIISNGRHDRLRERITDLIVFNFQIGLFITMHLLIWVQLLVLAWLGNQYLEVIPIMQVTILGLIPFIAFNMMRSIIDAVEVKAVNAGNLYKAFAVSLFFSIILAKAGLGAMGLIIAMLLGFWTLGFFTVRFLWVLYDVKLRDFFILRTVFLNLLFLGLALLVKYWLELRLNGLNLLISAFIIESILTFFYCYILWKSSVKWTIELVGRVINK